MIKVISPAYKLHISNVMILCSTDHQFGLQLDQRVLDDIIQHLVDAEMKETGGILIGNYNENLSVALVKIASGPPVDSIHSYTWFKRGTKGLQRLLFKVWDKKEYYLGEWHFHPNSSATPSSVDKAQMKEIAFNISYHCPEPILLIIGGTPIKYEIRCFVLTSKKSLLELFQTVNIN